MGFTLRQTFKFLFLTAAIYLCYFTSAIYHEKLLKHAYQGTNSADLFTETLGFTLFPPLFAMVFGYILTSTQTKTVNIPPQKSITIGLLLNLCVVTYNEAVIRASFPSVVMVKSCSLLSVILVAVFCSRVKDKSAKLGKEKILIGVIACLGIFLFNYFSEQQNNGQGVDHPISYLSSGLLIVSMIGDGFLPDLQAEIKATYKPSSYDMYYEINKYTFLCCLAICIFTFKIKYILLFCYDHPEFVIDMAALSTLNAVGQLFIYQMLKEFKQHIPSFVIAVRKCGTVVINILWFHHQVSSSQLMGIIFVFLAVMVQLYTNKCRKIEHQHQNQKPDRITIKQLDQDQILAKIQEELGPQYGCCAQTEIPHSTLQGVEWNRGLKTSIRLRQCLSDNEHKTSLKNGPQFQDHSYEKRKFIISTQEYSQL